MELIKSQESHQQIAGDQARPEFPPFHLATDCFQILARLSMELTCSINIKSVSRQQAFSSGLNGHAKMSLDQIRLRHPQLKIFSPRKARARGLSADQALAMKCSRHPKTMPGAFLVQVRVYTPGIFHTSRFIISHSPVAGSTLQLAKQCQLASSIFGVSALK